MSGQVTAWTQEQIAAWVDLRSPETGNGLPAGALPDYLVEAVKVGRRALVRLCPEVSDYDVLARRISALPGAARPLAWFRVTSPEELTARMESLVATLWQQSITAPYAPLNDVSPSGGYEDTGTVGKSRQAAPQDRPGATE